MAKSVGTGFLLMKESKASEIRSMNELSAISSFTKYTEILFSFMRDSRIMLSVIWLPRCSMTMSSRISLESYREEITIEIVLEFLLEGL